MPSRAARIFDLALRLTLSILVFLLMSWFEVAERRTGAPGAKRLRHANHRPMTRGATATTMPAPHDRPCACHG